MKRGPDLVEMLVIIAILVAFGFLYFSQDSSGGVAVVNLEEIAKRMDRDLEIQRELENFQASLQGKVQAKFTATQEQYDTMQAEYGDSPTQEQSDALSDLESQMKVQMQSAMVQIRSQLEAHRDRLIQAFRDEISPVAQQIAKKRGANVVFSKAPIVLSFDTSIDITQEVLSRLQDSRQTSANPDLMNGPVTSPIIDRSAVPSSDSDVAAPVQLDPNTAPDG